MTLIVKDAAILSPTRILALNTLSRLLGLTVITLYYRQYAELRGGTSSSGPACCQQLPGTTEPSTRDHYPLILVQDQNERQQTYFFSTHDLLIPEGFGE